LFVGAWVPRWVPRFNFLLSFCHLTPRKILEIETCIACLKMLDIERFSMLYVTTVKSLSSN